MWCRWERFELRGVAIDFGEAEISRSSIGTSRAGVTMVKKVHRDVDGG